MNDKVRAELPFWGLIAVLFGCGATVHGTPGLAMWFGFMIAGYSAIANDSIQTLGTFLSSNKNVRWYYLALFIGGLLVATLFGSYYSGDGDISFGRLSKIPQPREFALLQVCAPIILLVLTRYRVPVSTTFLLLSCFSSDVVIQAMLTKTLVGWVVACGVALGAWFVVAKVRPAWLGSGNYDRRLWRLLQAMTTGFLWVTWVMHDTANVAVYLPRELELGQMLLAIGYLFAIVGLVMFFRGGRIQAIVEEKTDVVDIRAATIIDFVYAIVLLVFKEWNEVPMSTTWVFLGLLAGREFALARFSGRDEPYRTSFKLVLKDLVRASIGLLISLIIALYVTNR